MPGRKRMTESDVLTVMGSLARGGVDAWVGGGWGIDAVVGETTRPHWDLDLAIRSTDMERAIEALGRLGYLPSLDPRPVRLVLEASAGRSVDLHPVTFDPEGVCHQSGDEGRTFEYPPEGFGSGAIGGVVVPCLTAEQLVRFHLGYEPQEHDRRDMAVLRDRLGIAVPPPY
jgi:lincosamide nucleotidyltransferase A/C/D/E